jgi:hypothetical protein
LKSAPPAPPLLVVVPPVVAPDGVGVAVPPVFDGVVVTGAVAGAPPDADVEPEEVGVAVVSVVDVVEVVAVAAGEAAGVPPDGGAVSTGTVFGTL